MPFLRQFQGELSHLDNIKMCKYSKKGMQGQACGSVLGKGLLCLLITHVHAYQSEAESTLMASPSTEDANCEMSQGCLQH